MRTNYVARSGCFLCVVVERAKKCLDFTATTHLIHLCCTVMYDGFPGSWEWWVVNCVSVVVMALLGEFLCMRREMQVCRCRALPSVT